MNFCGQEESTDDRYCFIVEWYDPNAALIRKYQLMFYPKDNTIDMYDMKNHRSFLRRSKADTVRLGDLYIGSTINLLSRQLTFVDYGDEFTRSKMGAKSERTLALIKPDGIAKMGQILEAISKNHFLIAKMKKCQLSRDEALNFNAEEQSKPSFGSLIELMSSGPLIAMELMGDGAIGRWSDLLSQFGAACHGSDSHASAARELEFFFPSTGASRRNTATFSDCTCCIIKPHAVMEGQAGSIISRVQDYGFEITALQMFHMEKANAEEFYEVYKGVVQEYPAMVQELTSGPCIAMEIRAQNAAKNFRDLVGPADPEIARHLRPRTLRANFGKDKVQNAVHCTDLPEDAPLEVEYFFKILDR